MEKNNMDSEKIVCAAIDYKGTIICGLRHSDCYKVLRRWISDDDLPERDKQGFLTTENRFVDRKEAWKIALANDQVVYGKDSSDEFLISENLY
jgi:hypothetical protein